MQAIDVLTVAADRGDLVDVQARLDRQPSPTRLAALRDHPNPAVVGAVLTHILQRIEAPTTQPGWWACLPTRIAPYPARVQQLAAQATLRLLPAASGPLPPWQTIRDAHTRAWWGAVALSANASELGALRGEALLQALRHVHAAHTTDPLALIEQLLQRAAPALHTAIARLITETAHTGRVAPDELAARIEPLLLSPDPDARTAAQALLETGWARLGTAPTATLSQALEAGIDVISTAAAWQRPDLLAQVHSGSSAPAALRRAALAAIGQVGDGPDLATAIACATHDPLLFGPALGTALSDFHARGLFIREPQLAPVLHVFLQTPAWSAQSLGTVCFTTRHALLAQLGDIPTDHPHARQIAAILVHLPVPAPELIQRLLASRCEATRVATLQAIGAGRWTQLEPDVLALLPEHPEHALQTLQIIGGRATADALHAALGLTGQPMQAWARHARARVLTLAWITSPEAQLLDALDAAASSGVPLELQGHPLPDLIRARLGHQLAPAALRLLSAETARRITGDDARAVVEWIDALARRADPQVLPLMGRLLVRHVRDAVCGLLPQAQPQWGGPPPSHSEPRISAQVTAAIIRLGKALGAQALSPPRPADPTAGHALLAQLLLEQLPDPAPAVETLLLTELTELDAPWISAAVQPYHRSEQPSTRRQAIRCLARHGDRGLIFNITDLAKSPDPITARAALDALVEFQPPGASAAFIAALAHPNMNVRRTAARALTTLPAPAAVPALIDWLQRHSNRGLRHDLLGALDATVGPGLRTHLLTAALANTAEGAPAHERLQAILTPWQRPEMTQPHTEPTLVDPREATSLRDHNALDHTGTFCKTPHRALHLIRAMAQPDPARSDAALLQFAHLQPQLPMHAIRGHLPWLLEQIPLRIDTRPPGAAALLSAEAARWMQALPVGEQIAVAEQVRATPTLWPSARMHWLTALSAAITPQDLHAAIADCAQSPGPAAARQALLQTLYPCDDEPELQTLIERCAEDPIALDALIAQRPPGGRWQLTAHHRARVQRAALRTHRRRATTPDATQRARRLTELRGTDAEAAHAAAKTLLGWPDAIAHQEVLQRWLDDQLPELPASAQLAQIAQHRPWRAQHAARLLTLCPLLEPSALATRVHWLIEQHALGQPGAEATLQRLDPELQLTHALMLADAGGPLYAPPAAGLRDSAALRALIEHLRRAQRPERHPLEQRCITPTRPSPEQLARALPSLPEAPGVEGWLNELKTGDRDACLVALRALRRHTTPVVARAVQDACEHAEPRVRAAAWRTLRDVAPREAYLEVSRARLTAKNLGVRCQAARALAYARDPASARALVGLLGHRDRALREAAERGVKNLGDLAEAELHRALRRARPDQRATYQVCLDALLDQP
jgi:HEAT repeat protein